MTSRSLSEVQPMKEGHPAVDDFGRGFRQQLELVEQERVALAEAAGGGDDVAAVGDHAVDPGFHPLRPNRIGRVEVAGIVGAEGRHHGS